MSFVSNTNIGALNALAHNNSTYKDLNTSLQRLSTGLRANSYAPNVGDGFAVDELRLKNSAITQDIKNANETLALLQVADKAIDSQLKILETIKKRAIQASSDTTSRADRESLQQEILALLEELDAISQNTKFNGKQLLTGAFANQRLQTSDKSTDEIRYSIGATDSFNIGNVRYETSNGGSRNISNLELNFKNAGINGEDIRLDKFHLSSSTGRTLKDLKNHINRYSDDLGGIRAVYKEGVRPDSHQAEVIERIKADKTHIAYDTPPSPVWVDGAEGGHNNNHPDTSATPPVEGNLNGNDGSPIKLRMTEKNAVDPRVKHEDDGDAPHPDGGSSLSGLTRQSTMITNQENKEEWIPVSSTRMTAVSSTPMTAESHNSNHPDTSATPPAEGNKNQTATMMDPRVKHEDDGQRATSDDGQSRTVDDSSSIDDGVEVEFRSVGEENKNPDKNHTITTKGQVASVDASPLEEVVIPQYRAVTLSRDVIIESINNNGTMVGSKDITLTGGDIKPTAYIEDDTWIDDSRYYELNPLLVWVELGGNLLSIVENKPDPADNDWQLLTVDVERGKPIYLRLEKKMNSHTRWNGRLYDPNGYLKAGSGDLKVESILSSGPDTFSKQLNFRAPSYPRLRPVMDTSGTSNLRGYDLVWKPLVPSQWQGKNIDKVENIRVVKKVAAINYYPQPLSVFGSLSRLDHSDSHYNISVQGNPTNIDLLFRGPRPTPTATNPIFKELASKPGEIDNAVTTTIDLGDTVSGLTLQHHNLPAGLTPNLIHTGRSRTAVITITGKAANHSDTDDVDNLSFEFRGDFSSRATQIATDPSVVISNLSVNFLEVPDFEIDRHFIESRTDDGSIGGVGIITLKNGRYTTLPTITATNIPAGLTPNYRSMNRSQIEVTLTGNALRHHNDVSNIKFELTSSTMSNPAGTSSLGNKGSIDNVSINFFTAPTMTISPNIFSEAEILNDGSLKQKKAIITLGDNTDYQFLAHRNLEIKSGTNVRNAFARNTHTQRMPSDLNIKSVPYYTSIGGQNYEFEMIQKSNNLNAPRNYRMGSGLRLSNTNRGAITIDIGSSRYTLGRVSSFATSHTFPIKHNGQDYTVRFHNPSPRPNNNTGWDVNISSNKKFNENQIKLDYVEKTGSVSIAHKTHNFNVPNDDYAIWDIVVKSDEPFKGNGYVVNYSDRNNNIQVGVATLPNNPFIISSPNLPAGLTIGAQNVLNSSQVEIEITGNAAAHTQLDDMNDLSFEITGGQFSNPLNLSPAPITDATIDFFDEIEAKLDSNIFSEHTIQDYAISKALDDGDIRDKRTITFIRRIPAGAPTTFTPQSSALKASVRDAQLNDIRNSLVTHNLPRNLQFSFKKLNPTQVRGRAQRESPQSRRRR